MFVQKQNFGVNSKLQFNFQHNGYDYPAHIHQFAELCYMVDGELNVTVNERLLTLCAGDILFIAPLQVHGYSTPTDCNALVMAFPTSILPEVGGIKSYTRSGRTPASDYFESIFLQGGLGTEVYKAPDPARVSYSQQFYIDLDDTGNAVRIRSALGALFAECESADGGEETDALARLLGWLGAHFTEPIDLSDAATALGYSRNYLSHRIKKLSGMTFRELVASLRIERASRLLGQMTVTDAALESGFENERSFYRAFRRITGTTPGEYMRDKHLYNSHKNAP